MDRSLDSYNDFFDPLIPFGLNYDWDVVGTDTTHVFNDQSHESNNLSQTTNKILQLSEKLNHWSSKFVVKDGDKYIDVSSAARGAKSIIPVGANQQIYRIQELSINFILSFSATVIPVNQM